MKAVRIHGFGGADVMQFEDVAVPEPGTDEILLRVHAASVNPVDFKTREGKFAPVGEDQLPLTLGRDVCGSVERCGDSVSGFAPGDAVYGLLGTERGGFAEYALLNTAEAAHKPISLGHAEAAAVPLAALTAWQGLFDHGGLKAGQRVLIHGGSGGVGHFAIQLARETGAEVVTTVSGGEVEFARSLGADQAIDYKTHRFERMLSDIDLVFDLIGGDTRARSWSVLKKGGILVSTVGQPDEDTAQEHGVRAAGYMAHGDAAQLAEIARLIDAGKIHPVIARHFPLKQAVEAEQVKEDGHVHGKIVLDIAA